MTSGLRIKLLTVFADLRAAAWAFATLPEAMELLLVGKLEPAAAFSVVHRWRRFKPVLPSSVCADSAKLALTISLIFFASCCRSESGEVVASGCKETTQLATCHMHWDLNQLPSRVPENPLSVLHAQSLLLLQTGA